MNYDIIIVFQLLRMEMYYLRYLSMIFQLLLFKTLWSYVDNFWQFNELFILLCQNLISETIQEMMCFVKQRSLQKLKAKTAIYQKILWFSVIFMLYERINVYLHPTHCISVSEHAKRVSYTYYGNYRFALHVIRISSIGVPYLNCYQWVSR